MTTETLPRNFADICNRILARIPSGPLWESLRFRVGKVLEDSSFTPPELRSRDWYKLSVVLSSTLPDPPTELWQRQVYAIVRNEEEPES
jgi:hypothetical protein